MGMYKYLQQAWQSEQMKEILKARMISWRAENAIAKIEYPSRLDRAHALGYKAKQGFILARVRIGKGTSKREFPAGGRKPTHRGLTSAARSHRMLRGKGRGFERRNNPEKR